MARKRTNGRFTKSTRRRRSKPKTNLSNVAQSLIIANAVVSGATNSGLVEFFTSSDGGGSSFNITARELVDYFVMGGSGGIFGPSAVNAGIDATPQAVMMRNIKANWPTMLGTAIFVPVAFNVATKLLRKPVILPANRMLKSVGLDVKV